MNFVKGNGNRFGIFYLLIGLLFFSIFLAYVWRFTVDDAYISFRYAKHLAEGYGLVWNCTLIVLLLLSANVTFISDLSWEHKYDDRLPIAHVTLGKALNDFSCHNLTFASIDAGAIPYFSKWRHIDMAGLNNKFIAKHGVAQQ